jgi:uncharacterized protein (DUF305 family)
VAKLVALQMPDCSSQERADITGYLTPEQMQQARSASPDHFDRTFIPLMTIHHADAVKMADQEWRSPSDPRLRIMAQAIRHAEQGEIALMNRTEGVAAVITTTQNILADNID